jgi:hypothetical protein
MLKKLLLVALAIAFVMPATAQYVRRVLIEEFTNASCPPCAAQNPAFNATLAANEQYVTPVKYQTNFPGFDPMNQQTQTDIAPRLPYYSVNSVPTGRQNGVLTVFPMTTYSAATIQAAYNDSTPVFIALTHALSPNYDSIYITVAVTSDDSLAGNLRLRVVVLEDEILFDAPPGSTNEKEFFQITRKLLPNAGGTATGNFSAGETKTYSFAWKLDYIYNLNELCAAAWLQDDATKAVWQSERTYPTGGIPDAAMSIASSASFACAPGYSPSFTLTNTSDDALTSANLRWRVGTGAWNPLVWTGNLSSGESETITLDTVFSQAGTYNVAVQGLSSNNGVQTNMVTSVLTASVKTLFGTASAVPFTQNFQTGSTLPAGWTINNVSTSSGLQGWKLATNAGYGGGLSKRSARCNMFDISVGTAYMTLPKIDLSAADGVTTLTFDHAYAYYSASLFDSLRIQVSNTCGETWETIFHDGKAGLATAPIATTAFIPDTSQWAANTLDLSAYNGSPELLIRFVGESGYGNNLYIDNINVTALVGVKELALNKFSIRSNPTRDLSQLIFGLEKAESVQLSVFNNQGSLVQSRNLGDLPSGEHFINLDANNLPSGTYHVMLQGKEGVATALWMVVK